MIKEQKDRELRQTQENGENSKGTETDRPDFDGIGCMHTG
jgi:hypothetical protein